MKLELISLGKASVETRQPQVVGGQDGIAHKFESF